MRRKAKREKDYLVEWTELHSDMDDESPRMLSPKTYVELFEWHLDMDDESPRMGIDFSGWERSLDDFAGLSLSDLEPAAASYFGPVVEKASPRYHGWLLHLIRAYLRDGLRAPAFLEVIDRGESFEAAWLSLPIGDLRTVGYFLEKMRGDNALLVILREIDYCPFKLGEPEGSQNLLRRILPAGGFFSAVRDGLADAEPACRVLAAHLLPQYIRDQELLGEVAEVARALAVLLDDEVCEVRWEAALQLAWLGNRFPEVRQTALTSASVLEAAVAANACYLPIRAAYVRGPVRSSHFLLALYELLDKDSNVFHRLGADAFPALALCLEAGRFPDSLRPAVATAIGRIGVVSVEILHLLASIQGDSHESQEVRQAAGEADAALKRLLAGGKATMPAGRPDEGLLLAIWQNPGDAALRLIYADWLEEHGHPERAEYVRLRPENLYPRVQSRQDTVNSAWLEMWQRLMAPLERP